MRHAACTGSVIQAPPIRDTKVSRLAKRMRCLDSRTAYESRDAMIVVVIHQ
jgi:hypothetical protein